MESKQPSQQIYRTPDAGNVQNQVLLQLRDRIEALKIEVQAQTAQQEQQNFKMSSIEKRLRDLYLDLDRRMQAIESDLTALKSGALSKPALDTSTGLKQSQATTTAGAEATDPTDPQIAYRQAFNHLKSGRYQESVAAFKNFLVKHPSSSYAPNAQYWLAEAHYALRQPNEALAEFERVAQKYPDSAKVPDALLKKGYILYEFKAWDAAEEILTKITTEFPESSAARLATSRLEQLQRDRL